MRVLVAVASKHGSTTEIAATIRAGLADHGLEADIERVDQVIDLHRYDAVILGSAVYMGRWLAPARLFINRFEDDLQTRPVWMFSSGPTGDPPRPDREPREVADLVARAGAREHRVFAGRLDKHELGFGERAVTAIVRAPQGDYRPWGDVEAWTTAIVGELSAVPV